MEKMEIKLRTLTPLWTGGVDQTPDRLHETGLIGSLRWWYEALVRGFGGYACDPTSEDRCPDNGGNRCVACELFGCTGWGRKFRLQALDKDGSLIKDALDTNTVFRLQFVELRLMRDEEKWLLAKAVEIAAIYGALGGRTTLKPQKRPRVGDDYGIVDLIQRPNVASDCHGVESYLKDPIWRQTRTMLPDLRWFFFVEGSFINRKQINSLIGLSQDGKIIVGMEDYQKFLRGQRGGKGDGKEGHAVSKKVFSFRSHGGRIWGYAYDKTMRDIIVAKISGMLGSAHYTVKTGEDVLHEL